MKQAQIWLEQLLSLMNFPAQVMVAEQFEKSLVMGPWLVIDENSLSPSQVQALLAERGNALDALQYLLNYVVNADGSSSLAPATTFTVELANFRSNRQSELISLSEAAAKQVRDTHQPVELDVMTSVDRRQVHSFFEESADLETESQGQEPYRRLVIRPRQ